jgi:hypothetical protein
LNKSAAKINLGDAEYTDKMANKFEEETRAEYLEAHPGLTQDQDSAAEVGGEVLEHVGVEEPNEQSAEEEGRQREEEPESRIEDDETAQAVAEKAEPLVDMLDNIKKSDLPEADKRQMLAELEYDLDNLIIEAQERYKRNREQLRESQRIVTADLAAIVSGKIELEEGQTRSVLTLIERKKLNGVEVNPTVGRSSGLVAHEDVQKLRDTLYTLLGSEGPGDWHEAQTSAVYSSLDTYNGNGGGIEHIEQAAVNTNLKGFKVIAERARPASGNDDREWEERVVLEKI